MAGRSRSRQRYTGYDWKFFWSGRPTSRRARAAELDYELWLGPAPYKPYHPHRVHATFRGYWDYDGGGLGDMGQHYLDPVQYLLGKDDTSPIRVDVDCPQQHYDAAGSWRRIEFTYADGCKIVVDRREPRYGCGLHHGAERANSPAASARTCRTSRS